MKWQVLHALPLPAGFRVQHALSLGEVENAAIPCLVVAEGLQALRRVQSEHGLDFSLGEQMLTPLLHQLPGRAADEVQQRIVKAAGERAQYLFQTLAGVGE